MNRGNVPPRTERTKTDTTSWPRSFQVTDWHNMENMERRYCSITPGSFLKYPPAAIRETGLWARCASALIQYGHSFILLKKLEPFFISPVEIKFPQGVVSRNCSWAVLLQNYLGNRSGSDCGLFSESISSGIHIGLISKQDLRVKNPASALTPPLCKCHESLTLFLLPSLQQNRKSERQHAYC